MFMQSLPAVTLLSLCVRKHDKVTYFEK